MITIDYFSDVLCVWAYGGQIRLDELRSRFGEQMCLREHFMPLFADTQVKIGEGWKGRGGYAGFGQHAIEVCQQWSHVQVHPDIWTTCRPAGCTNAHLFLRAAAALMGIDREHNSAEATTHFHQLVSRVREAFFAQGKDIAQMDVLLQLLTAEDPSPEGIRESIDSGAAAAALHRDAELATQFGVRGSPTYVFNDGRQILYGNVGYRIIEANIAELLSNRAPDAEASWC